MPLPRGGTDVLALRPGECVNKHCAAGRGKPRPYGGDGDLVSIAVILRSFATKNPVPFAANHGILR